MKDIHNFTREELIDKLAEKETIISALKGEKNQVELLNFPWVGNLGNWYWNIKDNSVVCNDQKVLALNYTKEEIPSHLDYSFFTDKVHPDHYDEVMENMRQHLLGNAPAYEVEYKIATKDGDWKWYYDRGIITKRDENGNPILMAGIVFDVTKEKELGELIKEQNERLLKIAHTDYLTGILNRRALFERLNVELQKANKEGTPLSVLMIDVDNFKYINDNYGHLAGDKALIKLIEIIERNLTDTDFVGRYGGEEFLIVYPQKKSEESYLLSEKIRKEIERLEIFESYSITISGGLKEHNGKSIDKLIDDADKALYQAKSKGKSQIIICREP